MSSLALGRPGAVLSLGRLIAAAALTIGLVTAGVVTAPPAYAATGTTYYVDAAAGDDQNPGTSATQPWRSLDQVSATEFEPGDQILLARGSAWPGAQLAPQGSGTADEPIVIGAYGEGALPSIPAQGQHDSAVRLWNQDHWQIRDLDVSNATFTPDPVAYNAAGRAGDFRGIDIGGDDGQAHHGFLVSGVHVHDVTGEVRWIGARAVTEPSGISFSNGWDRSKNTGGILVRGSVAEITAPGATATTLNDVVIENNIIENTSFGAITIKQYTGDAPGAVATNWGDRVDAVDPAFSPHQNISIRGNYVTQAGTAYGANGIYVTGAQHVVVEDNLVDKVGTCGIESYNTDDVVIQRNEVNYTVKKALGQDFNAIDADLASTKQIIQRNLVYGNGEGVLIYQQRFGDSIWRYNVIAGSTQTGIHINSQNGATGQIYNNTIVDSVGSIVDAGSQGGKYTFRNNLFVSSTGSATFTGNGNLSYRGNQYDGAVPSGNENAAFVAPAGFTGTLAAPISGVVRDADVDAALAFTPTPGSRAVNSAAAITDPGATDLAGTALYQGTPDYGAIEYTTPTGATTETIAGRLTNAISGAAVSGATVTAPGAAGSATSDASGWYALAGVPFGTAVTIGVTRDGYDTHSGGSVSVAPGTSSRLDIALQPNATTGTITGRLIDTAGGAVAGGSIALTDAAGAPLATATSDGAGQFSFDAAVGDGRRVVVDSVGHQRVTLSDIRIQPATVTALGDVVLPDRDVEYAYSQDFQSLPTGPLATGSGDLTVSASGGTVSVGEESSNRFGTVTRTATSGATSLSRVFAGPLTGVVTIEQDVRRPASSNTATAQFFGAPYIRNAAGQNVISVGFASGVISSYNGSTYLAQVGTYTPGAWVNVRVVLNTVTQKYDLYLDGHRVLKDAGFRVAVGAGIGSVITYADSANRGTVNVDDLRVARGIGYQPDEGALRSLSTDAGEPVQGGATDWSLIAPSGTEQLEVGATALSPYARSVSVNGTALTAQLPRATVTVGADPILIEVTAENGSKTTHRLTVTVPAPAVDRAALAAVLASSDALEKGDYSSSSWGPFDVKRSTAHTVFDDAAATQAQIDTAETELSTATDALASAVVAVTATTSRATYTVGETFDPGSVTVTGTFADGTTAPLAAGSYSIDGFSSTQAGTTTVTVRPNASLVATDGVVPTATFTVSIVAPVAAWSATAVYQGGETVNYNGSLWKASWWTSNQRPGDPNGPWQELKATADGTAVWTPSRIFLGGEIVSHNGVRYQAKWWTRNQQPGDPNGPWARVN
ncbi:carboxypeptidase regulatory-like domain-containing protein [Microbacteriaceae bacterium VKM Ac-2854]|nr:carboxypeptidase regulatory-like domain-containing protein [Microbacteriaceae bacterium VKM Ac-2854]